MSETKWTPEIYYQENKDGLTNGLPFINVPENFDMPGMLFIYEARDITEEDNELEKEIILRSYANMEILKSNLDIRTFNKVRLALGLKKLAEAKKKGSKITKKVNKSLGDI